MRLNPFRRRPTIPKADHEAVSEDLAIRRQARIDVWHSQLDAIRQQLDELEAIHKSRDAQNIQGPDITDGTHTRQTRITYGGLLDSYFGALSLVTRLERGLTKEDEWLFYEPDDELARRLSGLELRVAAYAGKDLLDLDRMRPKCFDCNGPLSQRIEHAAQATGLSVLCASCFQKWLAVYRAKYGQPPRPAGFTHERLTPLAPTWEEAMAVEDMARAEIAERPAHQ